MSTNYIFQTIHTLAHHPLHVAEHCRLLERDFFELFRRTLTLDETAMSAQIVDVLRSERVTRSFSVFVELRVYGNGQHEIIVGETSLYEGYAMRCINPVAQVVLLNSPFGMISTSARRESLSFANELARNIGGDVALECDERGCLHSIDGAALFAVENRVLISSPSLNSVERGLILEVAQRLHIPTEERAIWSDELSRFDEVFCCDHQGILAVSRIDEKPYMSVIAQKIASALTQPWV